MKLCRCKAALILLSAACLGLQPLLSADAVRAPIPAPPPGSALRAPGLRTNPPPAALPRVPGQTSTKKAPGTNTALSRTPGTNSAASTLSSKTNQSFQSLWQQVRGLSAKPGTLYPIIAGAICLFLILALVFSRRKRSGVAGSTQAGTTAAGTTRLGKAAIKKVHSCNVLEYAPETRQVWQFDARNNFAPGRHLSAAAGQALVGKLALKTWRSLFQRKLNIAWIPAEHVFLRVIHLPLSDFDETLSMVEFQLEKLSPMPVAQAVWSMQVLPHPTGNSQTVIVIVLARSVVEEFLGKLEGEGYLADRLELPVLDQLQATPITEEGAWIFPEGVGGKGTALVAWWYGGVLQNLALVTLPAPGTESNLKEELVQMAWAGEMDGWLTSPPSWHLVAQGPLAAEWETALRAALEQSVQIQAPLTPADLARHTASRAATADPRATLLPAEFALRYHQQFVDRLWIRGLGAILALYLLGVAVYFVALGFVGYQTRAVEKNVADLSPKYTNAIALKAQTRVLKDRQELRFAALDCWSLTAALMPQSLALDSMNFSDGKRLVLSGTSPSDKVADLINFEAAMRQGTNSTGNRMFDPVKGDNLSYHANPGAASVSWNFALELKRADTP